MADSNKVVSTTLVARGVQQYQRAMTQAAAANARLGASAAVPATKVGTLRTGMQNLATSAGLLNPALLGVGGVVYGMKSVVGAAVEWESAFAGVEKTVDGTDEQLAGLSDGLRAMSTEIPVAATELAGIAETAGQLGIETANVEDFTRVMADLGVATNMSSEQAATALARIANITQMSQDDFDRLGSTVVDLGNNLATTEAEITDMALRLAGAGNQAGLTESEILGLSGALSSVGINAEAGGTAFSKVMIEITNAAKSGGDELEQFAGIAGMTADQFARLFEEDPAEAVIAFVEGLGSASDAGENLFAILEDLGITEQRMRDALLRTAGAGDVLRESIERGNTAWEENIALTEEAEKRYETTEAQWQMLTNRIKDNAVELGNTVLPALNGALRELNDESGALASTWDTISSPFTWLDETANSMWGFETATSEASEAVVRAREATAEYGDHMGRMPATVNEAAGSIDGVAGSLDSAAQSAEEANTQLENYLDNIRASTDPVFALNQAVKAVDDAQANYNATLEDADATQADVEQAAFDLAMAVADLEQKSLDGNLSFRSFENQLQRWVDMGRITADEADIIRGRVENLTGATEDFEGDYTANLIANDQASAVVDRLIGRLGRVQGTYAARLTLQAANYSPRSTAGRTAGIRRYHDGGMVSGLRHDEVPAILQTGEMVLSRNDVSQLRAAITSGRSGMTVHQTFNANPDRRTLAEARHQQRLAYLEAV